MNFENPPYGVHEILNKIGPAMVGTAVSMFFMGGEWKKRLAQGAIGVPFAMYLAPSVDAVLDVFELTRGIDSLGAGVITGVFGIAVVSYCFEVLRQLQLGPILREWIKNKLGIKVGEDDKQPD